MRARLAVMAALALGACSLDPHYDRPRPLVPASWPVGDAYLRRSEAALPAVTYRDIFRDPRLQALIERALADNQDAALAAANIAQARALYRVQRADLLPQVDLGADASFSRNGGSGRTVTTGSGTTVGTGGGGSVSDSYRLTAGLASFEIDLFGRVRSLTRAALQQYLATEAGARATRLSLVGELAGAWLTYAADASLLAIAEDTRRSARRTVELTNARLVGGIAPRTDLRQAQTILERAESDLADLTTALAQDRNALDLLVGGPVRDAELPGPIETVDGSLGDLPAGLDAQVLLRRPDVVEAEYQLRAANARIGAARAAFFPRISLTAAAGFASSALSSLFSGGAFTWSAGPAASLPIFDGGANRGNLAYARASRDAAVAIYQRTIQTAFREVADALARRGTIDRQLAAETRLTAAAADTLTLSTASYRAGLSPFLETLDAQRTLYGARQTLAQTRLIRAQALVTQYRTLGGDALIAEGEDPAPRPLAPVAPTR